MAGRTTIKAVRRRDLALDVGIAVLTLGISLAVLAANGLGVPDPSARPLDGAGILLAMASTPTYNPNTVASNFTKLNSASRGSPLLNRATQGLYAPGSTFKVVTATAALESGKYTPQTTIDGHGSCLTNVQGQPLCNASGESAGVVSLTDALTFSYNTVFAQVGAKVGVSRMYSTMEGFGFFTDPPLDYPSDEMNPSGLYSRGHLLRRSAPVDIARVAIGQERLGVTPMQMAEVAATVRVLRASRTPRFPPRQDILVELPLRNDHPGGTSSARFLPQTLDISRWFNAERPLHSPAVQIQILQHTTRAGSGYFTLVGDIFSGP